MKNDIKKGTLFLLVGPSGSGKGPLIRRLREHYDGDDRFYFPQRVITRAVNMPDEKHIHATLDSFADAQEGNAFLLHWHTHGNHYGIPGHSLLELLNGRHVIINASRTIVETARAIYDPVKIFHIETKINTSFLRLKERGRETEDEIALRLKRHDLPYPDGSDVVHITEDGETEEAFLQAHSILENTLK